ncbi:hypothetical protein [Corynebacterium bovis]|uniref:hypothetical protein n=1 Tax=Corynebacterium bovis TaxID=36808 RepID=UPI00163ABFF9|nr:hypothetical protein [Corynebacterium bovis]
MTTAPRPTTFSTLSPPPAASAPHRALAVLVTAGLVAAPVTGAGTATAATDTSAAPARTSAPPPP